MLGRTILVPVLVAVSMWAELPPAPGVRNFSQVDARIYRGSQPDPQGFKSLRQLGIKTVIDLRGAGVDAERHLVESLGMQYLSFPLKSLTAPTDDEIAEVLRALDSRAATSDGPVFVHCRRGKDRTGVVVACYRISHDGWDNRKALEEARAHGLSPVERGMIHFILNYAPPQRTDRRGQQ